ncbi:hypothetical protein [Halobellus sp. GM3]|uniref:hypothetical protein n=1 Tax=Halobellus sp. GM3 TaxID=3458410 RepID=UPI00403DF009
MIASDGSTIRWKRPEYVGENRCLPCTAVNLVLTVALAIAFGSIWAPAGVGVAVVGIAAIYSRGYLVPGTPALTKRYFPDRILRLFDKHDELAAFDANAVDPSETEDAADVEAFFAAVGALEPCHDGADLCLTATFRDAWATRIDRYSDADGDADAAIVAPLFADLDIDEGGIETEVRHNAFVARLGSTTLARWESSAAAVADVAADSVLRDRSSAWRDLPYDRRMGLLGALRLWLDRCPDCEGAVELDEETVESCCRSYEVAASTCNECGTRLFEARLPDGGLAPE